MMAVTAVVVPDRATGDMTRDVAGRLRADPVEMRSVVGRDAAMFAELHASLADLHELLDGLCHERDMSVARHADGAMSSQDVGVSFPSGELGRRIAETRVRIAEVRSTLDRMAGRSDRIPGDR